MSTYSGSSLHEGGLYVVWVVEVVPDAVILLISVIIEHRCPCLLVQTMSPVTCQRKGKHRQCRVLITASALLQ